MPHVQILAALHVKNWIVAHKITGPLTIFHTKFHVPHEIVQFAHPKCTILPKQTIPPHFGLCKMYSSAPQFVQFGP